MTPVDKWLPDVLPHVPGCPDLVAQRHVVKAATRFCEATRLWRGQEQFRARDGLHTYELDAPTDAVVHCIEWMTFNGERVTPASLSELMARYPGVMMGAGTPGQPDIFSQTEMDTVVLAPVTTGVVVYGTVLAPTPAAETLPDFLYRHYFDAIAAGAVGYLKAMTGVAWSDPNGASLQYQIFNAAMTRGKTTASKGQQGARSRAKASFF